MPHQEEDVTSKVEEVEDFEGQESGVDATLSTLLVSILIALLILISIVLVLSCRAHPHHRR